jgi:hypothetical protein
MQGARAPRTHDPERGRQCGAFVGGGFYCDVGSGEMAHFKSATETQAETSANVRQRV